MGSTGPIIFGFLCAVIATSHAGVISTQETLIITKPVDAVIESATPGVSDPTTEGPLPPIKLLDMHVKSEVALRYSRTTVVTLVKNPAKRAQETTFKVLLPETAFISGFSMTIDGKTYDAYVKEKEEAKQIYTDAVSQGFGAAHVAAKARDSNHFTVSMNIEPNSVARFNLTYEELLVRQSSAYRQSINMLPGSTVANFTVVVHIKEPQKITTLRVPEITTGNEITPTEDDAQNTLAVITRSDDEREATVTFKPDIVEQKRLMEIYAAKTKESRANTHSWYSPDEEQESPEGILGQFVVQYDVDRTVGNEVLVNDGYFAHFFAPKDLTPLPKHVVFVLDTSGSMMERKIVQLREAMQLILSKLHSGDYFSIVEFSSDVTVHELSEADKEPEKPKPYYYYYERKSEPTKLIPPYPANPENIAKAKIIVGRLQADGGTNISGALEVAINLIYKGVGWTASETLSTTIEPVPVPEEIKSANSEPDSNKSVSTTEKTIVDTTKDAKNLEPMIIFLTDGDPTIGETDPKRIVRDLAEKNYGENKASIFSLAFGEDADRKFLRKLSLTNNGFMRHIYEAADAALQLNNFYDQVTSPLIANVKFTYPPEQVKEDSLTKIKFRTYYAGSEVIVAGRIEPTISEFSPEVSGFCGVDDGFYRKPYIIRPRIIVNQEEKHSYLPLERLWAYLTIKQLLDDRDAAEDLDKPKDQKEVPEKKALELALKYSFVTELTSLVVVKPNDTKAVNAESVDDNNDESSYGIALSALQGPGAGPGSAGGAYYAPLSLSAANFASRPAAAFSGFVGNAPPVQYDAIAPESAFQDFEEDSLSVDGGYLTTPYVQATYITEASVTATPNPLEPYHLEQYLWAEPLLDANTDELVLRINGTDIHLKLTKDVTAPQILGDAVTCSPATDSSAGSCVYLTSCEAAKNITSDVYTSSYCLFDNQYAGVCCPKADAASVVLPATDPSS